VKYFRRVAVRHWRKGLVGFVLILLASLLSFPQPLISRFLVDKVLVGHQLNYLGVALLLLIGIALSQKLLSLFQQFYLARFEQAVILDIQQELFGHCLSLPKSFFDAQETGYLMSRLSSDTQELQWVFSDTIVQMIANVLRLAGGIVFLLYLDWKLASCLLILFPAVVLLVAYFAEKLRVLSLRSMEQQALVATQLQESLSSISLIKAFSSEARTHQRLSSRLKSVLHLSLEQTTINSVAGFVIDVIPGAARAVVIAMGAYWVVRGHWTLGTLVAFQVYLGYIFGPAQFLATANLQIQNARAALERISSMLELVPEENSGKGETISKLCGEVEFKNVSFAYGGRESVIEDLTFRISPGQHCAIIGPSGIGKTTLLSLILQFYRPTAGEIYFDGRAASQCEVRSLRRRIGYVAQSTLLLSGTVRENLMYGNPAATAEDLAGATRAAGIYDFIGALPQGFETQIGEKGIALSEGQKQRLSIARALVQNPDIVILDEPTSALDCHNESSIFQALPPFMLHKTLFMVTHRLATIRECDRILLFDESRTITAGTHESLLKSSSYYQSLVFGAKIGPAASTLEVA
jgi:ABC-type bacteriocin/lantibiotic exporter with double-glycine peptidase domain